MTWNAASRFLPNLAERVNATIGTQQRFLRSPHKVRPQILYRRRVRVMLVVFEGPLCFSSLDYQEISAAPLHIRQFVGLRAHLRCRWRHQGQHCLRQFIQVPKLDERLVSFS